MSTSAYDVALVVEWENVQLAGDERGQIVLQRLVEETAALVDDGGQRLELVLVYDPDDGAPAADVMQALREQGQVQQIQQLAMADGRYYQKKNAGALMTVAPLIVFLDSDAIPEPGWLSAMVNTFADPTIQVVAGATYIRPDDFYHKAMACFWLFPLLPENTQVAPTEANFANNVAFRRQVFEQYPYPANEQFRGAAGRLHQSLREQGIETWLQPAARCQHPPPNGWQHFMRRAMCDGHDNVLRAQNEFGRSPWRQSYWTLRDWMPQHLNMARQRYPQLGLSHTSAVAVAALVSAYGSSIVLGEVLSRLNPAWMKRHFWI